MGDKTEKEKRDEITRRFYENTWHLHLAWKKSLPEQDKVLFGETGASEQEPAHPVEEYDG